MNCTGEAFTIRTYPYAEVHRIAVFLTREEGLLRGMAYGARKSPSRFGASLEPMTHVRVSFRRKEHQELAVIQNCEIIRPLPAYELSWEENLYVGYFAELLGEFAKEQIESEKLFRLTQAVTHEIGRVPIGLLARYLEFWILKFEGVLPPLNRFLPEALASKTFEVLRLPPSALRTLNITEGELKELETSTEQLVEAHLEKPLKARRMLKELL